MSPHVLDWFRELAAGNELPQAAATALNGEGFAILPGIVPQDKMPSLAAAYDAAFASAVDDEIRVGSTTTKINDFFNRGRLFEELVLLPPLLEGCCQVIGGPFKLSSFVGRTFATGRAEPGIARRRATEFRRLAAAGLHLHDRRVPG